MVKRTKVRINKKKAARLGPRPRLLGPMLDEGALAYRRLLLDPCNAPLVGPTYAGSHPGTYRRVRRIITINNNEVERITVFQPGSNTWWYGGHSAPNAGTPVTFIRTSLFGTENLWSDARCLAACVKVRYLGPESARSGVVALGTGGVFYDIQQSTTGPAVDEALGVCPVANRLGEVVHEVKFAPQAADEVFTPTSLESYVQTSDKSTMMVVLKGVPAGLVQLEITAVMEVSEENTGIVLSVLPPATRNTTNEVLRSLGSFTNWAFSHVVAPTLRSAAGAAMNTLASSAAYAAERMTVLAL